MQDLCRFGKVAHRLTFLHSDAKVGVSLSAEKPDRVDLPRDQANPICGTPPHR